MTRRLKEEASTFVLLLPSKDCVCVYIYISILSINRCMWNRGLIFTRPKKKKRTATFPGSSYYKSWHGDKLLWGPVCLHAGLHCLQPLADARGGGYQYGPCFSFICGRTHKCLASLLFLSESHMRKGFK